MSLIEELRQLAHQQADVDGDPSFHRGRMLTAEDTKYWQAATQLEAMQAEMAVTRANLALTLDKLEGLVPFMRAMRRSDAGDIQEFVTKARASLDRQGK